MAAFRQTTSRLDDPQLHTHLVVSAKVQTADGRWFALDARYLKRHQRAAGRSVPVGAARRTRPPLRGRLRTDRERPGRDRRRPRRPAGGVLEAERGGRRRDRRREVDEFVHREGRDPTRFEHAAIQREAAVDTRTRKTGNGQNDLRARWLGEAADVGSRPLRSRRRFAGPPRWSRRAAPTVTVDDVLDTLAERSSAWHRADVLRTICDTRPPRPPSRRPAVVGVDGPGRRHRPGRLRRPGPGGTARHTAPRLGRPVRVVGPDGTARHHRRRPGTGGTHPRPGPSTPRPPNPPRPATSTAPVSTSCSTPPPRRSPATTPSC